MRNHVAAHTVALGPNLFALSMSKYDEFKSKGEDISAFRFTDDRRYALLQDDPKKPLTEAEICTINLHCDKVEGLKNRQVKSSLMSAIRSHFSRIAGNGFQLIEFGAGRHPLTPGVRANSSSEYHAVEIDKNIITELNTKGISASTIEDLQPGTLKTDRARIAAGVYTLHLWDPDKAPDDIKRVISQDGFFVANYMTSKTILDPDHKENLLKSLKEEGLSVSIVTQGLTRKSQNARAYLRAEESLGNEFWVVSYPPERNGMKAESKRFAEQLMAHLPKPEGTYLQQTTYDAAKATDKSAQSLPQGPTLQ